VQQTVCKLSLEQTLHFSFEGGNQNQSLEEPGGMVDDENNPRR
jgi:hypothetical protein